MSFEDSWNKALEDLDPRIKKALTEVRMGRMTTEECDSIVKEVYPSEPNPIKEAVSAKTKEMFGKFLNGQITRQELQAFVDKLNQDPNSVL